MSAAIAFCRHLRLREVPMTPLLLAIGTDQVGELLLRDDLYDDFCVLPARPDELVARLQHLFWRTGQSMRPDIIEYGPLMLNLETYQAAVSGPRARPDLHGIRAPALPGRPPGQGLHPRDPAQPGLGLRVLRRRAHGRRAHPAPAGQARRGARPPDPDGPLGRLPLRSGGLAPRRGAAQRSLGAGGGSAGARPRQLRPPARRPRLRPRSGPRSGAPPPRRPNASAGSR